MEEQFLREMEELRSDNAFLQNTVTGLQANLDRMMRHYELLTQECEQCPDVRYHQAAIEARTHA